MDRLADTLAAFIVVFIVLCIIVLPFMISSYVERKADCDAMGGMMVRTAEGMRCLAVKEIHK